MTTVTTIRESQFDQLLENYLQDEEAREQLREIRLSNQEAYNDRITHQSMSYEERFGIE